MSLEILTAAGGMLNAPAVPSLEELPGVGKKRLEALEKRNIHDQLDLIFRLPTGYTDRRTAKPLNSLYGSSGKGMVHTRITVLHLDYFYARGKKVPKIWVDDGSARGALLCFGRPFLGRQAVPGSEWLLSGSFNLRHGEIQSSSFELVSGKNQADFFRIQPRYSAVPGIPAMVLNKLHDAALNRCRSLIADQPDFAGSTDFSGELKTLGLPDLTTALEYLHRPETVDQPSRGRRRLAYAELKALYFQRNQSAAAESGRSGGASPGPGPGSAPGTKRPGPALDPGMHPEHPDTGGSTGLPGDLGPGHSPGHPGPGTHPGGSCSQKLMASLPFSLTADQLSVYAGLADAFLRPPETHLLQGDVGSGKTLVALLAALDIMEAGGQAAFMVPTEILARQHLQSTRRLFAGAGLEDSYLSPRIYIADMPEEEKETCRREMEDGDAGLVIGTHSLFSRNVSFQSLKLVIIDEQHRFGVAQRGELSRKAENPHVLMLSATPIPRTLTMTLFNNMRLWTIRSMPGGRKPIHTHLAVMGKEEKVYRAIGELLARGERAYFVYPRIESDDNEPEQGLKSAEEMYEQLKRRFPDFSVGLVHGRQDMLTRQREMEAFQEGAHRILVATSVVEVGLDVPEATAMVIEHAERFGLAALHQLRGRVGRGALQSYCYLVYDHRLTADGKKRLRIMKEHTDGFIIAEEDLQIRGPGNIAGVEQSGYLDLEYASLYGDRDLIEAAARSFS